MGKSKLHKAALLWASRGVPVFPVWADDPAVGPKKLKSPLPGSHGFKDATTDPEIIDRWWSKNPKFNVAASPAATGCLVCDIDRPGAYAELEVEFGMLPATYTVQTPSGNRHLWYKGTAPASVSHLADKVDIRSEGSYVLLPPSIIHGKPYKVIEGDWSSIAPCPERYLAAMKPRDTAGIKDWKAPEGAIVDLPASIERAAATEKNWVAGNDPSLTGAGNNTLYLHACQLREFMLSPAVVFDILMRWNARLADPFSEDEVLGRVESAYKHAQNQFGVWSVEPPEKVFASYIGLIIPDTGYSETPAPGTDPFSAYQPLSEDEADLLPDQEWLIEGVLPQHATAVLYAPSKAWKTFVAVDWALTVASGIDKWGKVDQGAVVYVAAEGPSGMAKKRKPAWKMLHGVEAPMPFYIVPKMPWFIKPEHVHAMVKKIKATCGNPKLLVIDTLARAMATLDENSARDAGIAIEAIEMLKRDLDCTVLVLHHTGKVKGGGLRGSSALMAGFDTGLELETDKESMTTAIWPRWHKDAETRDAPWAMKAEKIGPSFALRFVTPEDIPPDERLRPADVGRLLERMGAISAEDAVTQFAIINELVQLKGWDKKDASRAFKGLLASGALAGFETDGRFFIPATATEEPLPLS